MHSNIRKNPLLNHLLGKENGSYLKEIATSKNLNGLKSIIYVSI